MVIFFFLQISFTEKGIGNYLRAEVLHRAGVPPFEKACDVFKTEAGDRVLQLCHDIPMEVLNLGTKKLLWYVTQKGLNKYGDENEVKKFNDWLQYCAPFR